MANATQLMDLGDCINHIALLLPLADLGRFATVSRNTWMRLMYDAGLWIAVCKRLPYLPLKPHRTHWHRPALLYPSLRLLERFPYLRYVLKSPMLAMTRDVTFTFPVGSEAECLDLFPRLTSNLALRELALNKGFSGTDARFKLLIKLLCDSRLMHLAIRNNASPLSYGALAGISTLRELILDGNALGDDGVAVLCAALRAHKTALSFMSLQDNQLGDAAATTLAVFAQVSTELLLLNVSRNPGITDEQGGEALSRAKDVRSLRIVVANTGIKAERARRFGEP